MSLANPSRSDSERLCTSPDCYPKCYRASSRFEGSSRSMAQPFRSNQIHDSDAGESRKNEIANSTNPRTTGDGTASINCLQPSNCVCSFSTG